MNSHICISEKVLLRFAETGSGNLYYLDTKHRCIKNKKAKYFLSEEGYYTPDVEKFLSDKLETQMGRIFKSIDVFIKGQQTIFETERNLSAFAKDAILIQSIRSPNYCRKYILPRLPHLPQGRIGARFMANKMLDEKNFGEWRRNIFNLHHATLLINETSHDFLLPSLQLYTVKYRSRETLILILSPQYALIFINEEDYQRNYAAKNGGYSYPYIENIEVVHEMNIACIKFDDTWGAGKIVGKREDLSKVGKELSFIDY